MRMIARTLIAGLTAALLATGPAPAQTPAPDAMDAARELVTTMQTADQFKALLPIIMKNLKPAIVQNRPEVDRDYDTIMPILMAGMMSRGRDRRRDHALTLTFTADELREVTAFYHRAVGQTFHEAPVIMQAWRSDKNSGSRSPAAAEPHRRGAAQAQQI